MSANIGITIYTKLSTTAAITALVGQRIYPNVAPLSAAQTFPYLVYSIVSSTPTNTKGNKDQGNAVIGGPQNQKSPLDIMNVQVSIFSGNIEESSTLSALVRATLDRGIGSGFSIGTGGPTIDSIIYDGMRSMYESDILPSGVFHIAQDYIIRVMNTYLDQNPFLNQFSLKFDGVDDFLQCGDSTDFEFSNGTTDSAFSFNFWVYMTSAAAPQGLFSKFATSLDGEYVVSISYNNLRIRMTDTTSGGHITLGTPLVPVPTNTWLNVCITYDGSGVQEGLKIYYNGTMPAQSYASGGTYVCMRPSPATLTIGAAVGGSHSENNTDEFSIFKTELTAAQVLTIYNAGTPLDIINTASVSTNLVAWWRMGEASAYPIILDSSANSNNAIMTNMSPNDIDNFVP